MNTGPDPPDPPDPSDPVRELLLETYQPSRAGVEMTAVLNKLPQIIRNSKVEDHTTIFRE